MLRTYHRAWLRFDLVAGVVLAAILVPQGMAYAELAGLPPVTGLYTTIACLVGYAIMGPSRVLVLGPDSSVSPLIFAAITPLAMASDDPATAVALAGMMAIIVGLIEIGLGLAKLGLVADLLSQEVQVGYMNGLAVTIIVGQLPKLCGFSTDADTFTEEVRAFFTGFADRNPTAIAIGLATLAVLLFLPRVNRVVPAVLVAVVGATVVTAVFDLDVRTVGSLPEGLPRPSLPWTDVSDIGPLLIAAVGITLVSLTDTIATATSFAARRGDEVNSNQEMIGIGTSNIAAGLFHGFAVSTSGSRTAVAEQSGAKSQLTGLVGAAAVALLLVLFPSVLADLPQPALAAVVISAALALTNVAALPSLLAGQEVLVGAVTRGECRCDLLRRAPGHRDRRRAVDHPVLPTELVAPRRTARRGPARLAQHQVRGPRRRAARRDRLPLGGTALLRQLGDLPATDPPARSGPPAPMDRAPVRGRHRHRRDRRRDARAPRRRAQRGGRPHGLRRAANATARPAQPLRPLQHPRARPLLRLHRRGARRHRLDHRRRQARRRGTAMTPEPSQEPPTRLLRDLDRDERRRLVGRTLFHTALVVVLFLGAYYLVPFDGGDLRSVVVRTILSLACVVAVVGWQIRAVTTAVYPQIRAIQALVFASLVTLVVFAGFYLSLSHNYDGAFNESLGQTSSLYFTLTTLATVGYGDIAAKSDTARIVVMIQMVADVAVLGAAIRLIVGRTRSRVEYAGGSFGPGPGAGPNR